MYAVEKRYFAVHTSDQRNGSFLFIIKLIIRLLFQALLRGLWEAQPPHFASHLIFVPIFKLMQGISLV